MNVLVAGVGNVFLKDDGFGPEVIRRLPELPSGVRAVDYGVRGLHLAFELLDAPDLLVVVDALPRGEPAGTVTLLDPDVDRLPPAAGEAHGMDLLAVFSQVKLMGGELPPLRIVGCEPGDVGEGMGLTPAVEAAVEPAVALVLKVTGDEVSSWTKS